MEDSIFPSPKRARCLQDWVRPGHPANVSGRRRQVFLRHVDIEGFKTFRERCVGICLELEPEIPDVRRDLNLAHILALVLH